MNLKNLNVSELNAQEIMTTEGGAMIHPLHGVLNEIRGFWNDFIDGFNDGSGANCGK
ncbi:hypothetical protein [Chryseobacterium indologenes]|jgi:hypothetical protein|uniref:hypothetical protein n=1 Tax=Chryseobacterium indologenes TaxID=253 RepID=UPI00161ED993|nr:hypothetical protein [Chryseobacterium indologenes]